MTKLTTLPRIIFFGDSLTQYGWSYDGGWLSIIADALVRQVDVIGRGYSGYNTRMCRSMLPHLFPDAASLGSCRMFTIFLGANDASTLGQNVPVEEYESNLTAMIQHVKTLGVSQDRILLITLPPADVDVWNAKQREEGKPPNREFKFCPIYAAACKSVALSNDVKFVNLFEMMYAEEGEKGQSNKLGPYDKLDDAVKVFEKKFKDKTLQKWSDRENFVFNPKKYSLLDIIAREIPEELPNMIKASDSDCSPSKLDRGTQSLIARIFDRSMFEYTMKEMNLDVKKMPLGQLSAKQIASAYEVLDELDQVLRGKQKGDVDGLSSRFYSLMPHNFGRQRPLALSSPDMLPEKFDLLNTLSDVALAQQMQKDCESKAKPKSAKKPNPLDEKYSMLNCHLEWLNANDENRKMIEEFFKNTGHESFKIINVWRMRRDGEPERYKQHSNLENRKLLWHGTSVAVVAAILKTGLRIMPHSGGLVGKGIYFASQATKSQGYGSSDADRHRIMFLSEVALGKEHHIFKSDCSLKAPPTGYDSIIAIGRQESDPKGAKCLQLDGHKVTVPFSPPRSVKVDSHFSYGEYLIYKESQCQLRYIVEYS